jgi:hypothetical protein
MATPNPQHHVRWTAHREAESEGRHQFSLRRLFLWVAVAAILCAAVAGLREALRRAQYAAAKSAYGNRRFTRAEAEAIAGHILDNLRDNEFREISD